MLKDRNSTIALNLNWTRKPLSLSKFLMVSKHFPQALSNLFIEPSDSAKGISFCLNREKCFAIDEKHAWSREYLKLYPTVYHSVWVSLSFNQHVTRRARSIPRMNFGPSSITTTCPNCQSTISTKVEKEASSTTHLVAFLLCLCFCPAVCCPYLCDVSWYLKLTYRNLIIDCYVYFSKSN